MVSLPFPVDSDGNSIPNNFLSLSDSMLALRIFRIFSLDWTQINEVLILGFGAGSIAEIIASYKPKCAITGVEIDSKVIELGKKYFGNEQLKNNEIICSSADVFVKNTDKKFDLIIINIAIEYLKVL